MLKETFSYSGGPEFNAAAISRVTLAVATQQDREVIYQIRHVVYAGELGQYLSNPSGRLTDRLDDWNIYLVAKNDSKILGFISITPPRRPSYSIDKYFDRAQLPFACTDALFEIRLLTVVAAHRRRALALLLMYAAFRWVESHGGEHVVAIGRREILPLYTRAGLETGNLSVKSGAVTYELLHASVSALRAHTVTISRLLDRVEATTDWRLHFPFRRPAPCFHGGAFFKAVGERFDSLDKHRAIINADVLDAWFAPSPKVLSAIEEHLPWLLRTSPPTSCQGLIETIATARGVKGQNILPGGGSSDLIFRAFRQWLTPASRVLILDPTYGEYFHVLNRVVGCDVQFLRLSRARNYQVDLEQLATQLAQDYDLVVLVNPNSPTGQHIPRSSLEPLLRAAPLRTRIWVDETYIEYAGQAQSLEQFASSSENVIVCKSMSKVYALSGARVAYLCAAPHQLESLRAITPPWVVSLPAQVAAVNALQDPDYYADRYRQTHLLRAQFAKALTEFDWQIVSGIANFLLCHLPPDGPTASAVVRDCSEFGLFLRDASSMGSRLGPRTIRIAVKDAQTNARIVEIIRLVLGKSASVAYLNSICSSTSSFNCPAIGSSSFLRLSRAFIFARSM